MNKSHRGTIFQAEAEVLQQTSYPGGQYIARLHAPDCARVRTQWRCLYDCGMAPRLSRQCFFGFL